MVMSDHVAIIIPAMSSEPIEFARSISPFRQHRTRSQRGESSCFHSPASTDLGPCRAEARPVLHRQKRRLRHSFPPQGQGCWVLPRNLKL